jgi:hypothetical protein
MNLKVWTAPGLAHLVLKRRSYFALYEAKSVIWCGGSQSVFRIIGYFLHVCQNGQRWAHRNAAQMLGFTKSLCLCNYTQSRRDRPQSHSSKPCSDNAEVQGIEWTAAGICTSCPTGAKQSSTQMAIELRTQWLWYQSKWSSPPLWSGSNERSSLSDELTQHHDDDDILNSRRSAGLYKTAYREWRLRVVTWWGWMIIIRAVKWISASSNIQPTQSHQLIQLRQMVWRTRRNWEVQKYLIAFDSISC